jgi:multicomponent K+:H+ antiporter subunit G
MTPLLDAFIALLLIIAGTFGLIGSYGLIRLKDGMQRLHSPTKASTVGLGAALLASMFHGLLIGKGFSSQELLVMVFIFITAPISANYLSKLHLHARRYDIPPPEAPRDWATFDHAPEPDQPHLPQRKS